MLLRALVICSLVVMPFTARAETSPLAAASTEFVRAQAASKIQWQPWTEAVLAQAKQQNKSVYVFIGSPLSELTRATINQTFTSERTIPWLNENFFCIFVDADAQPDVAALGQHFVVSVKQLRGQPVHLWLTPDTLQPYDGANYLPPSEEWGKPGFLKAARAALDTWKVDPARAKALANEAAEMMRLPALDLNAKIDVAAKLEAAAKAWTAAIDPVNGGFGSAPKLPEPELIRFLLTRDAPAREAALNAARALVNGAARDPVDGGFYRRCMDEAWKEPYLQKTLIDQARIAVALFETADAAKDVKLRAAGIGALDFVLKELKNPDGTFAAALDGTLEENSDPSKRPKFVRVGSASTAALGLFAAALERSGEKRFREAGGKLIDRFPHDRRLVAVAKMISPTHSMESTGFPTAADNLAFLLGMRALGIEPDTAHALVLEGTNFDERTGAYMTVNRMPLGVDTHIPALGETPSAEVLALLAGVDAKTADLIRRNLMNQIEYDELPPGDILLGLSQTLK
jgi:uncharacterized protein YyaL (SSP411 family)